MNKRIFCALLAALMIVLMLPVQAFAATEEIKGAYVGQKFEHVIGNVVGAKTFSKSGDIPEGLKVSGAWAYKNTYGDYVLKITLEGRPSKAGTYNFSIKTQLNYRFSISLFSLFLRYRIQMFKIIIFPTISPRSWTLMRCTRTDICLIYPKMCSSSS